MSRISLSDPSSAAIGEWDRCISPYQNLWVGHRCISWILQCFEEGPCSKSTAVKSPTKYLIYFRLPRAKFHSHLTSGQILTFINSWHLLPTGLPRPTGVQCSLWGLHSSASIMFQAVTLVNCWQESSCILLITLLWLKRSVINCTM